MAERQGTLVTPATASALGKGSGQAVTDTEAAASGAEPRLVEANHHGLAGDTEGPSQLVDVLDATGPGSLQPGTWNEQTACEVVTD